MLDTLIECVRIIFIHQSTIKNIRILDFLSTLIHITHINYANNKNLSLVFDALIDVFSQVKENTDLIYATESNRFNISNISPISRCFFYQRTISSLKK